MSLQTTITNYKKARSLYKDIDDKWYELQSGNIEPNNFLIDELIRKTERLNFFVSKIDVNDINTSDFSEKAKKAAIDNINIFKEAAYYLSRVFLGQKYYEDLESALAIKFVPKLNISPGKSKLYGAEDNEELAKQIAGFMTKPENIKDYLNKIKRISLGTMSINEFKKMWELIKEQIRKPIKFVKEDFENPFDDSETDKKNLNKVKHFKDQGGLLRLRKETFNSNRIEVSKKKKGRYSVFAKTQFAQGEIVEICPVMILGAEATAVDKLKDIIFEIDKENGEWGLVLGYGSLYNHSFKPNCEYAYNKLTKQMLFMTLIPIKASEELTINFGKDYWNARTKFNLMGTGKEEPSNAEIITKSVEESEVQPNKSDIDQNRTTAMMAEPNGKFNPAYNGVAIQGTGQS